MSDARHFSFRSASLKGLLVTLTLVAGGCTTSSLDNLSLNPAKQKKQPVAVAGNKKPTTLAKAASSRPAEAVSTSNAFRDDKTSKSIDLQSAWCRYTDANARAESTILRSPTIAGDINDDGNGGVSISYDFVDLARANLKEETAAAQCRRYKVSSRIARMMLITPQSLTLSGNNAKANYLKGKRKTLVSIKRKVKRHIANGEITAQAGTVLIQLVETVISSEHAARAEALRRASIGKLEYGSTAGLDRELEDTERQLQEITRRSRSFEALKVSVSAGYGYQGDSGIQANSGYGKVKLSYRLGAMSPVRRDYEDIAAEARVSALHEKNRGILWQSSEMSSSIARARSGLVAQRRQLIRAMGEARQNADRYVKGYETEMLLPRYKGQIDQIALAAQLRGVDATLADMKHIERNLRFRQ